MSSFGRLSRIKILVSTLNTVEKGLNVDGTCYRITVFFSPAQMHTTRHMHKKKPSDE